MGIPMVLLRDRSKQAAADLHRGEKSPSPGGNLPSDRYLTRMALLLQSSVYIVAQRDENCNSQLSDRRKYVRICEKGRALSPLDEC